MKSICLVASHTPTKEKQDALRNLVRKLKKEKKDIFLISHSLTPSDIISDVNYHFYDCENEFLSDDKYKGWGYIDFFGDTLVTKDIIKQSTSLLPCTRNLFFGLFISKMLGYDVLHYIEYDSEITNIKIIENNDSLTEEYDGVYYQTKRGFGIESNHLFGPYSVYNLNSYTYDELLWDRAKILNEFSKEENNTLVEKVTESLLINTKNFKSFDSSTLIEQGFNPDIIKSYSDSTIEYKTLFYDNGKLHVYCSNNNQNQINENIDIIINESTYLNIPVIEPNMFHYITIGELKDIKKVKLFSNNRLIFEYTFENDEEIETFKTNNKIIKKN
jgi:hypothetical protein